MGARPDKRPRVFKTGQKHADKLGQVGYETHDTALCNGPKGQYGRLPGPPVLFLQALLHYWGDYRQQFFLKDGGENIEAGCTALAHVPAGHLVCVLFCFFLAMCRRPIEHLQCQPLRLCPRGAQADMPKPKLKLCGELNIT